MIQKAFEKTKDTTSQAPSPADLTPEKAPKSLASIIDRFPAGFDRGFAKLAMSYKAVELLRYFKKEKNVDSQDVESAVNSMADLGSKLGEYEIRSDSLKGSAWGRLKRTAQGVSSFLSESSAVLAMTVVGSVVSSGVGAVSASSVATYPQVFGSTFVQQLEKGGYDLSDSHQIKDALRDDEFMSKAQRASRVSAGQMTSAVFVGGMAAGYAYSVAAKPVEQAGASLARDVFARMAIDIGDGSARAVGKGAASLARSGVNAVGKKVVTSIPVRSFALAAGVKRVADEAPKAGDFTAHVDSFKRYEAEMTGMPHAA